MAPAASVGPRNYPSLDVVTRCSPTKRVDPSTGNFNRWAADPGEGEI
jgi:hypothetical protein